MAGQGRQADPPASRVRESRTMRWSRSTAALAVSNDHLRWHAPGPFGIRNHLRAADTEKSTTHAGTHSPAAVPPEARCGPDSASPAIALGAGLRRTEDNRHVLLARRAAARPRGRLFGLQLVIAARAGDCRRQVEGVRLSAQTSIPTGTRGQQRPHRRAAVACGAVAAKTCLRARGR